ncbi:MAG TPA: CPBP family intramembrane glutamic endopeptidase [Thermomicrobiaceae bacterium]|nr:CPBP family intramembrane glutamic endopeptidase [Thermomicrobiaceae bacterium]
MATNGRRHARGPSAASARPAARPRSLRGANGLAALGYLAAIGLAELVAATVNPEWGVLMHVAILCALLLQAALAPWSWPDQAFFLALVIAPLIRIVSLGMPLGRFAQEWWYLLTAVPLFAACFVLTRTIGLPRAAIGLRLPQPRDWPLTLLVALSGLALGGLEYLILRPAPIVSGGSFGPLLLASLILLVCTGVIEELIFRGILLVTVGALLGSTGSAIYTSVLFGLMHIGHLSVLDVFFVTAVALYFTAAVRRTGSLLGVSLSHGLTNIVLFVVLPLLLR